MGCGNSQMVKVSPDADPATKSVTDKNGNDVEGSVINKRVGSAASRSSKDSGLEDDMRSEVTSLRTASGVSRRTLGSLKPASAKGRVRPVESEGDVLAMLREEGLIATDTQKGRSGLAFQVLEDASSARRPMPLRLAKLEKRKKKSKLLTQQDIQAKLEKAEIRRKEAEAERLSKIHSVTVKSDITHALDAFAVHQKSIETQSTTKVDMAAENREKKLKELRDKLRSREEHAARVRQRKLLAKQVPDDSEQPHETNQE